MRGKSDRASYLVTLLRDGYTLTDAAKKADVAPSTVALWRKKGKEDYENNRDTWHAHFWRESEDARFYACSVLENLLYAEALSGSMAAGLRWLDCFAPEGYGESVERLRCARAKSLCERFSDEC